MLRRHVVIQFVLLIYGFGGLRLAPASEENESKDSLGRILAHQAALVRSAESTFTVLREPTPSSWVPSIKAACAAQGQAAQWSRFVVTSQFARANSYRAHWYRRGALERLDTYAIEMTTSQDEAPSVSTAFDGRVVRSLTRTPEGATGMIDSIDSAKWRQINRIHPFSLLFQHQEVPYSDIIAASADVEILQVTHDRAQCTQLNCTHPQIPNIRFGLLFDNQHRLIQRDVIAQIPPDEKPRLWERHELVDYQDHSDESGETVWFPKRAVYHYYMGTLNSVTPVEYMREIISIDSIQFNVPIPDKLFALDFPSNARVYDGLGGRGFLDEVTASSLRPANPAHFNWILLLGLAGVVLVFIGLIIRYRLRSSVVPV